MNDAVIVALVGGACAVFSSLITAAVSKNSFSMELDKRISLLQQDIKYLTEDLKTLTTEVKRHNDFAVRVPLLESKVKDLERANHGT